MKPALLPLLMLAARLQAQTSLHEIKPEPGTNLTLEVYKTGLMSGKKHILVFERYAGSLNYNAANPELSRLDLSIEAAQLAVKDDWVSAGQLKDIHKETLGKDVLDVAKFPAIRFVSSSMARAGDGFALQGMLTVRGQDKPVTVNVTMKPGEAGVLRFEGKAIVKLKDYGIKPPGAPLGIISTRNEMPLLFSLIARPRR